MAKIYIASSWRNGVQPMLVDALRKLGHEVYDFRHPKGRNDTVVWDAVTPQLSLEKKYKQGLLSPADFDNMLQDPVARMRFREHYEGMLTSDICVLLLPCGRSGHVEAGFMAGLGKKVFVYDVSEIAQPELMYLCFNGYYYNISDLTAGIATSLSV